MARLVAAAAERVGNWIHRFLTEVIASAVTTACVAGATTLYLHYGDAPEPAAPPAPSATANFADLLSPVADPGAVGLMAAPREVARVVQPALPPARPRGEKTTHEANTRPKAVTKATEDLFVVPVEAAAAFGPSVGDVAGPGETGIAQGRAEAPADPEARVSAAQDGSEPSFSPPPADTAHPDRRLLGLPVPDVLPSNEDVARGFRGIGQAVGSLIP
jgi:hypothetical protein